MSIFAKADSMVTAAFEKLMTELREEHLMPQGSQLEEHLMPQGSQLEEHLLPQGSQLAESQLHVTASAMPAVRVRSDQEAMPAVRVRSDQEAHLDHVDAMFIHMQNEISAYLGHVSAQIRLRLEEVREMRRKRVHHHA